MSLARLVLMRHAPASMSGDSDRDRCLSAEGEAVAAAQGRRLEALVSSIQKVLVSPARRTRQTAELALPTAIPSELCEAIYEASAGELLQVLEGHHEEQLMLVGHNPGISTLASHLTGQALHMAPGAIAVVDFSPPAAYPLQGESGNLSHWLTPDQPGR